MENHQSPHLPPLMRLPQVWWRGGMPGTSSLWVPNRPMPRPCATPKERTSNLVKVNHPGIASGCLPSGREVPGPTSCWLPWVRLPQGYLRKAQIAVVPDLLRGVQGRSSNPVIPHQSITGRLLLVCGVTWPWQQRLHMRQHHRGPRQMLQGARQSLTRGTRSPSPCSVPFRASSRTHCLHMAGWWWQW